MSRGVSVELTSFVGRRKELAEGRRMLRSARLVTLVGAGGVGKTRLAQRLARQVERVFRDGVVWVELAAHSDPAGVAGQVAAALGVDPQSQSVEEALTAYLRSRQMLLVLDNCEHLVDACARLSTSLLPAAPAMRILATSRERLRVAGEHVIDVGPLGVPTLEEAAAGTLGHVEAVALLADRVRAIDPRFKVDPSNAQAVARLSRRLDGIPLAIELAAPRLRVLSLQQIVDRLDERFDLLTTGSRAALPRHQTLRGLLDWSYDLCSPDEQTLWARMSVFEGGADLAAIEGICAEPGVATAEVLTGLVDKSVVSITQTDGFVRYRMLDTIREYGAEQLADCGETDSIRDRHRDFFVLRSERTESAWFGPDQKTLLAATTADLANLRAAFDHGAREPEGSSSALRLATSMQWYWPSAGAMEEGTRWFTRVLSDREEESSEMLRALTAAALVAAAMSDLDASAMYARRAVATLLVDATPRDRGARHQALAVLASLEGDHEEAQRQHASAAVQHELAADAGRRVGGLMNVAVIGMALGRLEEAREVLMLALGICDEHSERFDKLDVLLIYADVVGQLGRTDEAFEVLEAILGDATGRRHFTTAIAMELMSRTLASVGQARRAAVLLGIRSRFHQDFGIAPGFYVQNGYWTLEKQLPDSLGETAYQAAHAEGFALSLDAAVQVALGRSPSAPAVSVASAFPTALSNRERQVAELLAQGYANKEIAEELVISPRTAEGHVAKVLDKLGVHSREQVAAWLGASSQE